MFFGMEGMFPKKEDTWLHGRWCVEAKMREVWVLSISRHITLLCFSNIFTSFIISWSFHGSPWHGNAFIPMELLLMKGVELVLSSGVILCPWLTISSWLLPIKFNEVIRFLFGLMFGILVCQNGNINSFALLQGALSSWFVSFLIGSLAENFDCPSLFKLLLN